ncbi:MAG TPA: hypothetical protein VLG25_02165 [Patescibacteria group bacterium]|nr:hypothetical protein [Patescibacteria group bacterium]
MPRLFVALGITVGLVAASPGSGECMNQYFAADKAALEAKGLPNGKVSPDHLVTETTYNIRGAKAGVPAIAATINSQRSTVTCLEEVWASDISALKRQTGYKYAIPAWAISKNNDLFGNVLLTNLEPIKVGNPPRYGETIPLPHKPRHEARSMGIARLRLGERILTVGFTHFENKPAWPFDNRNEDREMQASRFTAESFINNIDIACLDSNDTPGSTTDNIMLGTSDNMANSLAAEGLITYPNREEQIDMIRIGSRSNLVALGIGTLASNASDHCLTYGITAVKP